MVAAVVEWIEPPATLGEADEGLAKNKHLFEVEPAYDRRQFSTTEKLLILGILLNVVSIGWGVYQWRESKKT